MYEYVKRRAGLGWSDWMPDGQFQTCSQVVGGVKKCFTSTAEDRACAENSNCFELSDGCQTTSGGTGNLWCCPRNLPPPPGNPCLPQGTEMVCQRHAIRCANLQDNDSYSICRIQKALCDLGVDPGPIDGRGGSNMYRIAVRMYKARVGIQPVNDEITDSLLERLGVIGDDRVRSGVQDTNRGTRVPSPSYFWPVACGISSVFLMFSWWKWGRRGR